MLAKTPPIKYPLDIVLSLQMLEKILHKPHFKFVLKIKSNTLHCLHILNLQQKCFF